MADSAITARLHGLALLGLILATASVADCDTPNNAPHMGNVFTAGGIDSDDNTAVRNVFQLVIDDAYSVYALPYKVYGNSLTSVGSVLYSCGGKDDYDQLTADCYSCNFETPPGNWTKWYSLPKTMAYHTAVDVGSHIWFTSGSSLYDIDTVTGNVETYTLDFVYNDYHCAVSNGTHSVLLGAGIYNDEIWMNEEAGSSSSWVKKGSMVEGRHYFGCVWIRDQIFVTGGDGTMLSAEKINTSNIYSFISSSAGTLTDKRFRHKMFEFYGKPAVIGGLYNDSYILSSIEIYDKTIDRWVVDIRDIWYGTGYYDFGSTQLRPSIT